MTEVGRLLILRRYTRPEGDHALLLTELHLRLPTQPLPRIALWGEIQPASSLALY